MAGATFLKQTETSVEMHNMNLTVLNVLYFGEIDA